MVAFAKPGTRYSLSTYCGDSVGNVPVAAVACGTPFPAGIGVTAIDDTSTAARGCRLIDSGDAAASAALVRTTTDVTATAGAAARCFIPDEAARTVRARS